MIIPSAVAATRHAIELRGARVTFTRVTGFAPNTSSFSASVLAIVQNYVADSGVVARTGDSASSPGAITQGDRQVLVMTEDLKRLRFPLPLTKNDKITLSSTGEQLNIVSVDAGKRAIAGCIECSAAGVL
jgi:hypothetical protein